MSHTQHTLQEIIDRCKCEVFVTANEHRCDYDSVAVHLADEQTRHGNEPVATPDVIAKMIEMDTVIALQFYPRTTIGFYTVYHYSLDAAINEAFEILDGLQA